MPSSPHARQLECPANRESAPSAQSHRCPQPLARPGSAFRLFYFVEQFGQSSLATILVLFGWNFFSACRVSLAISSSCFRNSTLLICPDSKRSFSASSRSESCLNFGLPPCPRRRRLSLTSISLAFFGSGSRVLLPAGRHRAPACRGHRAPHRHARSDVSARWFCPSECHISLP